jgi:tRNA(fMet)-specific endonuclease VapC
VYLLDTDTLSELLRGRPRLSARVLATPASEIWISVITVEEMLRGRLAVINQQRQRGKRLSEAYAELQRLLEHLQRANVDHFARIPGVRVEDWT